MQGDIVSRVLLPLILGFIRFSLGLGLTPGDFRRILAHEVEARDLRVVGVLIRCAEFLEQGERAGSFVGAADVEQA